MENHRMGMGLDTVSNLHMKIWSLYSISVLIWFLLLGDGTVSISVVFLKFWRYWRWRQMQEPHFLHLIHVINIVYHVWWAWFVVPCVKAMYDWLSSCICIDALIISYWRIQREKERERLQCHALSDLFFTLFIDVHQH